MSLSKTALAVAIAATVSVPAFASSHREAPFITTAPKVDGTDFYMFRSYEPGREDFVTFIANYLPLQDAYGGPNYFSLDPNALYEIHVDNNGDAAEDITFGFRFSNTLKGLTLPIGPDGAGVAVPLRNIGGIGPGVVDSGNSNVIETYQVSVTRGDRRSGQRSMASNPEGATSSSRQHRRQVDCQLSGLRQQPHLPDCHSRLHDQRTGVRRSAQGRVSHQPRPGV